MLRVYVVLASVVFASPALCASFPDPYGEDKCADLAFRRSQIESIKKGFEEVVSHVERVPPGDTAYFRDEMADAVTSKNRARFQMVYNNPAYHAMKVREAFSKFSKDIADAASSDARKSAIALFAAYENAWEMSESLSSYVDFDAKRATRVIPLKEVSDLFSDLVIRRHWIRRAFECAMSQVK